MGLFLTLILVTVVGTALFDIFYYLPRFKALEEEEEKSSKVNPKDLKSSLCSSL